LRLRATALALRVGLALFTAAAYRPCASRAPLITLYYDLQRAFVSEKRPHSFGHGEIKNEVKCDFCFEFSCDMP
jgi:hypothetical protein